MEAKYIFAASRLRADVAVSASALPVLSGDGNQFLLGIGEYTFLRITDGRNTEIVRYNGGPFSLDMIPVQRAQLGTRAFVWSRGVCVEAILTPEMLIQLVADTCNTCVETAFCSAACSLTNQVLNSNNTWVGTNSFRGDVSLGAASISPASSVCPVVTMNAGWSTVMDTDAPCDVSGYSARVRRIFGTQGTAGAVLHAASAIGVNGPVVGLSAMADAEEDSAPSLTGADLTLRSQENSNSSPKTGVLLTLQNRADPASAVILGANRYNINSAAVRLTAQTPSTTGEYLGWERGIVFEEGSLARSLVMKSIGLDFAALSPADVANCEAGIRMRSGLAIEMNGDIAAYDSKKFVYSTSNRQFQLMDYSNYRFGLDAKSGIMYLSDIGGAPGTLLAAAAGAASGQYLNIFCNGARYKIALLNP